MKHWYILKMVEAYHESRFDDAMNYAKMAGIESADIARIAEADRELLE